MDIRTCTLDDVTHALQSGACVVVDVREAAELRAAALEGARHAPLSDLDRHVEGLKAANTSPLLIVCRSGKRARSAAERLVAAGVNDVMVMEGGLLAWEAAGKPLRRSGAWSLERQVRFTAGLLVLAGVIPGLLVHPAFLAIAAFVGAGLAFSGITDTCGMGMMLAKMPWNRVAAPVPAACPVAPPAGGATPRT